MPFSLTKLIAATLLVTATTVDDAIWLVRYTSPTLPLHTRIVHGALFVVTLECLVCGSVGVALALRWAVGAKDVGDGAKSERSGRLDSDIILASIGAALCWIIAIVLYVRKLLKRRRRARESAMLHRATTQKVSNRYGSIDCPECDKLGVSPHDAEEAGEDDDDTSDGNEGDEDKVSSRPSPLTVISLTAIGALDEVSYFPSLVLGNIFTPLDLCVGTLLAAGIVLAVVTLFLSMCRPLLHWLDSIPLYGIVAVFAIVLTASVIVDIVSKDD